jgi:hypothetical protein
MAGGQGQRDTAIAIKDTFGKAADDISSKAAAFHDLTAENALSSARTFASADDELGSRISGLDPGSVADDAHPVGGQKISDVLDPAGDTPYTGARSLSPEEQEAQDAADAARAYDRIRNTTGDTQRIADNTRIDKSVLDRVKSHLFEDEHDLPVPPDGHIVTSRFTPDKSISDLWEKADAGTLTPAEREQFQGLMQHESVESRLMQQGMPYRSADPAAWDDGMNWPSGEHYGAHDISPHATRPDDPWYGWNRMGFPDPPPATPISRDLSNIDDVVSEIRQRMGI